MRSITDFNEGWLFEGRDAVRLPHTAVELPFSYFDETVYQRAFTYEKRFTAEPDWDGKEVVVHFEGAMAGSAVILNGETLVRHDDGYTPFEVRLTGRLKPGENVLTVKIDGSENPAIPPFGGMIDYLTYAGIYRDVWLQVTDPVAIDNAKIETPDALADTKRVEVSVTLSNPRKMAVEGTLTGVLKDSAGAEIARTDAPVNTDQANLAFESLTGIDLWDIGDPVLYTLEVSLDTNSDSDAKPFRFGFRTAEFTTEGFFLNGRLLKLRGLNRHQSFPYAGYALGKSAQVRDAEILKNELKLNCVRTSHYPQSVHFLDRCDELGLLVFEEIPGWQHIGDTDWQARSVDNVRRMIERDWNHPSIFLWGVRINESADNRDFYTETNRLAHELDATRQTGGVRCITDSELLEDVYTMNDFFLGQEELGGNRPRTPLRPQQEVTGLDHAVPYMVTEYNGHMYPTKQYDQEQRQAEHVLRHLQVLNAAYGDPQVAGAIGWCAFDYNTHKDFGSGDRVCYHGVMDMFREPKFAAHVYASQCDPDEAVVMEPVTFWSRGDRNIGGVMPLIVLSNCDAVEIRYGNHPPKQVGPDRENFPHLPHAPIVLDKRHFTEAELGSWGMEWLDAEIVGYVDGKQVASRRFVADPVPTTLELVADAAAIDVHDSVRLVARVCDQAGNKLPYQFDSVSISVDGPAELVGPAIVPVQGGATGFWIKGTGTGAVKVSVAHPRLAVAQAELVVQ